MNSSTFLLQHIYILYNMYTCLLYMLSTEHWHEGKFTYTFYQEQVALMMGILSALYLQQASGTLLEA